MEGGGRVRVRADRPGGSGQRRARDCHAVEWWDADDYASDDALGEAWPSSRVEPVLDPCAAPTCCDGHLGGSRHECADVGRQRERECAVQLRAQLVLDQGLHRSGLRSDPPGRAASAPCSARAARPHTPPGTQGSSPRTAGRTDHSSPDASDERGSSCKDRPPRSTYYCSTRCTPKARLLALASSS